MEISNKLDANLRHFHQLLRVNENFDVVYRVIQIGGRDACVYFVDGFAKDDTLLRILQGFTSLKPDAVPQTAHEFSKLFIPYGEVDLLTDDAEIAVQVLSGVPCLFVDGYSKCFAIDCRTYPARGVAEPDKDKVLRGSRDGFVETLVFNTALIRRRIRDPQMTIEVMQAGIKSHTDIALCYMEGWIRIF